MKRRLSAFLTVITVALSISGSAFAFDCMRVSSSLQGLQQSTRSGNWTLVDLSNPTALHDSILAISQGQVALTPSQAACVYQVYAASGQPQFFALGTGVAGGKTGNGPGVVASGAPSKVLTNGTGIDHFDETVLPVLRGALFGTCANA